MKTLQTLTIMASIWTFFSCNSKGQDNSFKPNSIQDTKSKIVRQNIFGEETSFNYSDFNDLKNNKNYDSFLIGQLYLPTGQVVCTDPMYRELGLPQNWTVKKGDYPVYIYIGLSDDFEGRVAYAELVIKDEIPTYWELSLISENLLSDNFEKKMNEHRLCDIGADVLNLSIGILLSICTKLNICTLNSPTSQSRKPLPTAFILTHHPVYDFENSGTTYDKAFTETINEQFVTQFYKGHTNQDDQKKQNKELYNRLRNKKDIIVLFPDIAKLTDKLCYSYNKFVDLIINNDVYIEILNDETTISTYFENS
jgi:hypothetical protein